MYKKILTGLFIIPLAACEDSNVENHSPILIGSPQTRTEVNQEYSFKPVATDPDGDQLIFSIENKPEWAQFDTGSGQLSGTPTEIADHTDIRVSVSDGDLTASLHFSLIVIESNDENSAPSITADVPPSIQVGQEFSFTPRVSDPDGDEVSLTVSNLPSWLSFQSNTNRLFGTPSAEGQFDNITLTASDGELSTAFIFSLTVIEDTQTANTAPDISGTPGSQVFVNETFSFIPSASDVDGDVLTFSVENKPAWAVFNTETGEISGQPSVVGTYENIVVSVSDGIESVSLPSFNIEVVANTKSVTIEWQAPTQDTNGANLTGLQGFKVLYGKVAGNPDNVVEVNNVSQSSLELSDLEVGEYFFYMTAIDTQGRESARSQAYNLIVE